MGSAKGNARIDGRRGPSECGWSKLGNSDSGSWPTESIGEGEEIGEYTGECIDEAEMERRKAEEYLKAYTERKETVRHCPYLLITL